MIVEKLTSLIKDVLGDLKYEQVSFVVEHPEILAHGDYSTNVAMVLAKQVGENPKEIAQKILDALNQGKIKEIESTTLAGGFINFHLSQSFFQKSIEEIVDRGDKYGTNNRLKGEKTIVEYTDPNPFKEFHIGHLMSNTIGESISRLIASQGAEVKRACYSGDKGIHVAKAVAYELQKKVEWKTIKNVADSYASGSRLYETDTSFKTFVVEVNKKIYEETDKEVNEVYMLGRHLTLDYFEGLYKILGTQFDYYFFESTTGEFGKVIVHEHPDIFEKSDGAIVYHGETRDKKLHTRVFMNKEGLPTYEAKELGLAKIKYDTYPYSTSIVITGNEVKEYFKVLLSAMNEIFPELADKTHHITHGMLRLPSGKMSSRTGDVITAESLIDEVKEKVVVKINASDRDIVDKNSLAEQVAISAIKYSILKQATGRDIIFDFDKSISFEGDSGPYLQYTYARAHSILEKAKAEDIKPRIIVGETLNDLEKTLYRYGEVVERASKEYAPHYLVTYLTELASMFNSFYANGQIVNSEDKNSPHKVALTSAVAQILQNGLRLLGILTPNKM